jgi:hypothetical protein
MKKLASIGAVLLMSLAMTTASAQDKKPEMKKHCVTQKDAKTGKDREVCKMIRVHKKLEVKDDKK